MALFFKKKTKELPPLDFPPNPPHIEDFGNLPPLPPIRPRERGLSHLEELPPLPKIEEKEEMPEFPELPELPLLEEHREEHHLEAKAPEYEAEELHEFFRPEEMTTENLPHIEKPRPLKDLELEEIEEKQFHDFRPLFVRSDDYKEIMKGIQEIKNKVNESDAILMNLNEIKNQKDKEFQRVHSQIADIQRKLVYVDKVVFGG